METITAHVRSAQVTTTHTAIEQVVQILRWTFGIVPIVAGIDKFLHILTNWDQYLAPAIAHILPFSTHTFMLIVGIIEIIAGILVLAKPKIGSIIVSAWLVGIVLNLLLTGTYFDIAIRDLVMAISAFCLFKLTNEHREKRTQS